MKRILVLFLLLHYLCFAAEAGKYKAGLELIEFFLSKGVPDSELIEFRRFSDEMQSILMPIAHQLDASEVHVLKSLAHHGSPEDLRKLAMVATRKGDFWKVLNDPKSHEFLAKYPKFAEGLYLTSKNCPGRQTLDLFRAILLLPQGERIGQKILPGLKEAHIISLSRAIKGQSASPKILKEAFNLGRHHDAPAAGVLFEQIVVKHPIFPKLCGTKNGTSFISGQYNGIHGIDMIGVSSKGQPIICDATLGKHFLAKQDVRGMMQMSPEWVAERWNRLLLSDEKRRELKALGIDEAYLEIVTSEQVRTFFIRKIITVEGASVQGLPRVELSGAKDLITL